MEFANPFDEQLALHGPPAIFLFARDGLLRFDETWTRDAYGRAEGPHERRPVWALLRDQGTGFVMMVYSTAASLLEDHPRLQVRMYDTRDVAEHARASFGEPPLSDEPW